jgi:hypothetical protein
VSVERIIHCDAEDCEVHVRTLQPPPYVPLGFIEAREGAHAGDALVKHFHSWDCCMKFAATIPAPVVVPFHDPPDPED